jgi:APA family basic amino acid/polyamine antiporter
VNTLRRAIGLPRATALVAGIIIGASIFVQPSEVARHVPSVSGVFIVWLAAGILTLCGALLCAELASAFPTAGGVYGFLKEAFGPGVGFLWGWAMFWSMHSGIVAAIGVVFARYVGHFVPLDDTGIRLVAIGGIAAVSGLNYAGVRLASAVQTGLTGAKILAIVLIIAVGFTLGAALPEHFQGAAAAAPIGAEGFALALIAGLFTYGGWHMVTYAAEETADPSRTLPRALVIGTLLVTACYVALNVVYLYVLPLDRVVASTRVAADAADALLGSGGAGVAAALVVLSTLGALTGVVLAGPRVYYAMSRDGLLFRWLGAVHPVHGTPHRAIVIQAVWSSVLVATGSFAALFRQVVFTEWVFFGVMAIGAVLLRRRPGYAPAYRMWGFPAVPLLFALSCALVAGARIIAEPLASALGVALVVAGYPVYRLWIRQRTPGATAT